MTEQLKAAKKIAAVAEKVAAESTTNKTDAIADAKRSYSIHSKAGVSSIHKQTAIAYSSNGSNKGEDFDLSSSAYLNLNSPTMLLGDTTQDPDDLNKLRRLVAHYRGGCKRIEIQYKDYKSKTTKEVAALKDKLKVEQQRRIKFQEEKIERLTQLMSDIAEKDKSIFNLNKQLANMQILLQTQGMISNGDEPDVTANEITQNLTELHSLAI